MTALAGSTTVPSSVLLIVCPIRHAHDMVSMQIAFASFVTLIWFVPLLLKHRALSAASHTISHDLSGVNDVYWHFLTVIYDFRGRINGICPGLFMVCTEGVGEPGSNLAQPESRAGRRFRRGVMDRDCDGRRYRQVHTEFAF
jgi:hypothetical protein